MRTKSLRDYLKLPGATDRDWASLGISIMALPSCLGNIWASANGAAWGSFEVDGLPPGDPRLLCFKLWSAEGQVVSLSLSRFPWVSGVKQKGSKEALECW